MDATTTVARLYCDEPTARRLATYFSECLDPEDTACAAFEGDDGRWQLAIHFRTTPNDAALRVLMELGADGATADALTIEPVAAVDWVAQSLAGLAPVHAGRFIVHGAHDRVRVKSNNIGIEIEAALAFGTGHHGTTRGCLLALAELAKRRCLRRVLDLGTGSGVLAIAAARIMPAHITASDTDRVAIDAARANLRLNRVARAITLLQANGTRAPTISANATYDLIFANITLSALIRLAVPVHRLAAPGAHVILSGLLLSHANAALAIYRAQGLTLERRIPLDGWVTLVLRRGKKRNRPGRGSPGRLRR